MTNSCLTFDLTTTDGKARRGQVTVPHGSFETPAFMPVGTRATVKGLMPRDLRETGSEICLSNTYHLYISPGPQIIKKLGGLHHFMGWDAPILTDSGGYQVFSLPKSNLDEEGVTFEFEKRGGKKITLTPEKSMQIQQDLGADIIMAFDVVVPHPCEYQDAREAVYRTIRWLERCKEAHQRDDQALFGIVQGSTYADLRALSAQLTTEIDLPGYAIGGLSVGEGHELMMSTIDQTEPAMPTEKPRYLMGVGYPEDIIEAVARGVDMFDCVIPSRYARSGVAFTRRGRFRVSNARYKSDKFPLDTNCNCYCCRNFSRAYLNHLINTNEILGSALMTLHNVTFYQDMMRAIRMSIEEGSFDKFREAFLDEYLSDKKRKEIGLADLDGRYDQQDFGWDVEHSVVPPTDIARNLEKTGPVDEVAGPERRIENIKKRSD
ncbi:MAG: tRNA guanosine(34) transglycosylase Tgt [Persicimonas sp.]